MCLCGQAAGETEAEDCFSPRKQRATQVTEMSQNFSQLWRHSPIRAHESEGRRSKGNVRLSWATRDPVSKEKQPNTFLNQTKGRVRQFALLFDYGVHAQVWLWVSACTAWSMCGSLLLRDLGTTAVVMLCQLVQVLQVKEVLLRKIWEGVKH